MTEATDLDRGGVGLAPFDLEGAGDDSELGGDPRPMHPVHAELIAAAGASLLLIALLFMKWFGVGGPVGRFAPRAAATGSEGAWGALTVVRWPVLLAVAIALLPLLARAAHRWVGTPRRMYSLVAAVGAITTLLLSYRVLIDLPDPNHVVDQKAGAILGLLGTLLIVVGGAESMRAQAALAPPRRRPRRARGVASEIARINA